MPLSIADRAVLDFKPRLPPLTDDQWLVMVDVEGISRSLMICFGHWFSCLHAADRLEPGSKEFYATIFGAAGLSAHILSQGTPRMFVLEMLSKEWKPEELGELGEWAELSGLGVHVNAILRAMLNLDCC